VTDSAGRRERAIEMHAFDERVHAQDVEAVPFGLDHGGIVADADSHPIRRWRQAVLNAGDEVALGQIRESGARRCRLAGCAAIGWVHFA
jgi:hypothetical protein